MTPSACLDCYLLVCLCGSRSLQLWLLFIASLPHRALCLCIPSAGVTGYPAFEITPAVTLAQQALTRGVTSPSPQHWRYLTTSHKHRLKYKTVIKKKIQFVQVLFRSLPSFDFRDKLQDTPGIAQRQMSFLIEKMGDGFEGGLSG